MRLQKYFPLIAFSVNKECRYVFACPFIWDEKSEKLIRNDKHYLKWKRVSCFLFVYFCFLIRGILKYFNGIKGPHSDLAYHAIYLISFFISLCDKINCFWRRRSYVGTYNGFLKYFVTFADTYYTATSEISERQRKREMILELELKLLISNVLVIPVLGMIHYCRDPLSRVYLTSEAIVNYLEGMNVFLKALYYIILGLFHCFMLVNMIADIVVQAICTSLPVFFYSSVFTEFRSQTCFTLETTENDNDLELNEPEVKSRNAAVTKREKRRSQQRNIRHFYRTAQIVQVHYCRLFEGRLLPMDFIMSYFVIIGLLCLIRYNQVLSWEIKVIISLAALSGYFGWAVCLWFLGQYFLASNKFLRWWKNFDFGDSKDNKEMKKFFQSCQPTEVVTEPRLLRFRLRHLFKYMHFINWGLCKGLVATGEAIE